MGFVLALGRIIVDLEGVMVTKYLKGLLLATTLLTTYAYADPINQPPPAGPVVLDLNGTPVPHSYQTYTTSFVATAASTNISFAFREDPAFLLLDNVSVTTGGGSNLLTNGNFDAGVVGSSAPVGWTYLNIFGATFGGVVQAGCGTGGSNCYFDGAVQAYDFITQAIATTIGLTYNIAFDLSDNGGLITFSALSTNGDVTDTGGNGVNLLVYAGGLPTPATVPLPGALPLFATGLGALGLLGWRKRRKSAAVTAAA